MKLVKDIAASVNARLRNLARAKNLEFNRVQLLYFQERFLARIAQSKHQKHLILKGGLLLYNHYLQEARPTRDLDLLGRTINSNIPTVENIVSEILDLDLNDGVSFDKQSLKGKIIKEGAEYEGVRIKFLAYLGKARQPLQLDIGFGDIVSPESINYPTLLDNKPFTLLAYPIEVVISEKLQAATALYTSNSRFKDFFDIYLLMQKTDLDTSLLIKAIQATFAHRKTPLEDTKRLFQASFYLDLERQRQWTIARKRFVADSPQEFSDVVKAIELFLEKIFSKN